ncbi:hypothetical protein [uncultured Helicobacter sp.]|nr:hypothetical protein [uncultured Helicobacter sp.]
MLGIQSGLGHLIIIDGRNLIAMEYDDCGDDFYRDFRALCSLSF